jgi:EpsI family protein
LTAAADSRLRGRLHGVGSAALAALALAACTAVAFWPSLQWLVARWSAPDGYFSHGPLVPAASLWLAWRGRARLRAATGDGSWWGLAWIAPALAFGVASAWLRKDSPAALALLFLLPGFALLFGGRERLRALAFPLAFLAFAWPFPMFAVVEAIDFLKRIVVPASCALVNLFGAGMQARGSFLLLPGGGRLLVDDECSGLKSALALVALGAFMAGTARGLGKKTRVLLCALALPIAVVANVFRVALLAAIGRVGGVAEANRWHGPSNWAVYVVAIAIYVGLERLLRGKRGVPSPPPPAAPPAPPHPAVAGANRARTVVALALTAAAAVATWRCARPRPSTAVPFTASIEKAIGDWAGRDRSLTPRQYELLETRDILFREYARGGDLVLACVAVAGADGKAAHPPEICYRGQGWDVVEQRQAVHALAGRERKIDRLRVRQDGVELLVWSWYRVGSDETPDWLEEQQLAFAATFAGRDDRAALLRFSTSLGKVAPEDVAATAAAEAAAEARLLDFVGKFLPAYDAALAAAK